MSAPNTNVEKQEKRHKGPLAGMGAAVAWGLGLLGLLVIWLMWNSNDPDDGVPQGAETGAVVTEGAETTGTETTGTTTGN